MPQYNVTVIGGKVRVFLSVGAGRGTYWYILNFLYCANLITNLIHNMLTTALILANLIPITKIGPTCPLGYYSTASYCTPIKTRLQTTQSIPQTSKTCPLGAYRTGNYCTWPLRY